MSYMPDVPNRIVLIVSNVAPWVGCRSAISMDRPADINSMARISLAHVLVSFLCHCLCDDMPRVCNKYGAF